jgi:23S rRNA (uracil1939-C5)-methyltransferase
MECKYQQICGGCPLRNLSTAEYQNGKTAHFNSLLAVIKQKDIPQGRPFFIADGTRRRAEFTFRCHKGTVAFGFNQRQSHEIADIENCLLLTPKINSVLKATKNFVTDLCHIKPALQITEKAKKKNTPPHNLLPEMFCSPKPITDLIFF